MTRVPSRAKPDFGCRLARACRSNPPPRGISPARRRSPLSRPVLPTGHRRSWIRLLFLAALTFGATASPAASPVTASGSPRGTPAKVAVGVPQEASADCRLGATGKPAWSVKRLAPPDDAYYTFIDPETCRCPGPSGVRLPTAHVMLEFTAGCGIPASVALVEADMTDKLCPVPLPDAFLYKPIDFELSVGEAGTYDFTFPLEIGDCIAQSAFLVITFLGDGSCKEAPMLVTTERCDACAS